MRIVVTGVPGVGKSTVMKAAAMAKNLTILNYGDVMFEFAKEMNIKDRDEIRKLPLETQQELQRQAAIQLGELDDIIIDTHNTIKTSKGYLPGLPKRVIQEIRPKTIFLVEASPEEIFKRRNKDDSRERDQDTVEDIQEQQDFNRMAAMAAALMVSATVKIIVNADGKVDQAMKSILGSL
jgi:adenylate kinase